MCCEGCSVSGLRSWHAHAVNKSATLYLPLNGTGLTSDLLTWFGRMQAVHCQLV